MGSSYHSTQIDRYKINTGVSSYDQSCFGHYQLLRQTFNVSLLSLRKRAIHIFVTFKVPTKFDWIATCINPKFDDSLFEFCKIYYTIEEIESKFQKIITSIKYESVLKVIHHSFDHKYFISTDVETNNRKVPKLIPELKYASQSNDDFVVSTVCELEPQSIAVCQIESIIHYADDDLTSKTNCVEPCVQKTENVDQQLLQNGESTNITRDNNFNANENDVLNLTPGISNINWQENMIPFLVYTPLYEDKKRLVKLSRIKLHDIDWSYPYIQRRYFVSTNEIYLTSSLITLVIVRDCKTFLQTINISHWGKRDHVPLIHIYCIGSKSVDRFFDGMDPNKAGSPIIRQFVRKLKGRCF